MKRIFFTTATFTILAILSTSITATALDTPQQHEASSIDGTSQRSHDPLDAEDAVRSIDLALADLGASADSTGAPVPISGSTAPPISVGVDVVATTSSGDAVGMGLPLGLELKEPVAIGTTAVYAEAGDSASIGLQTVEGNGFRALIAISSPEAPGSYSFPFDLPTGAALALQSDGSVEIVGADGATRGVVAPPWARDARGEEVPTAYAVDGNTLVQTVDFDATAAFPIVADPTFQGDCGIITCTLRLNRASTRNARDAGWLIAAAAGGCAVISAGVGAVVCGAAVAPAATLLAVAAGRYWENGNCLGIKIAVAPGTPSWPTQVKKNTFNCR